MRAKPTEVTGAAAAVHLPCAAVDGRKRKKKPVVDVPLTVGFPYSRVTGEKPKKMFKKKRNEKKPMAVCCFFFSAKVTDLFKKKKLTVAAVTYWF